MEELRKMAEIKVNGKKVYSDKSIESIAGTRINFTDRSWCDVETGEVVNNGRGSISMGVPAGESNKKETVKKSFKANAASILKLTKLCADVNVQLDSVSQLVVKIEGPVSVLKDIDISESGNELCIKSKGGKSSGGINIQSGGDSISIGNISQDVCLSSGSIIIGNNRIVSGNGISIGGSETANETKITVSVPKGTQIDVSDISGKVDIGDIEGNLEASVRGSSEIYVGCVKDTNLKARGSGSITVREVNGSFLNTVASGSCNIRINKGSVTTLVSSASGSGNIWFGGEAESAVLTASGSGNVQANLVKNRPITNISGSGHINIGNW